MGEIMLDKNFIAMSKYLSLAAIGRCGEIPDEIDITSVLRYAGEQAVIPLVVSGIVTEGKYATDPIVLKAQELVLQMLAKNIQNGFVIKSIFEDYKKENIDYAVLKGESIAALYKEPDLRISSDVDLLVSPKHEKKALKILEKYGYYYNKRSKWSNETVAKHDKYKLIEVHCELFDESRNDIMFNHINKSPDKFERLNTENYGVINVLSPDDGLMFVFLHFVKHFLSAGAGMRQLMDVIVYSMKHLNDIDWNKFYSDIKQLKYYNLFAGIITVSLKIFEISEAKLPDVEIKEDVAIKILKDIQNSGIFGYNEQELRLFKQAYEKKRFSTFMSGEYSNYAKRFKRSKMKLIFPEISIMKKKYKYVEKYPVLVVFAWASRIIKAALNIVLRRKNIEEYNINQQFVENEKIADRMKLMQELGLL